MQAALITGRHQLELREFPEPDPAPSGVVVAVSYCGICGTDIHAYQSGDPYNPSVCGHEWAGVIAKAGGEASGSLSEGDRVVIGVPPACGTCAACRAGQVSSCQTVMQAMRGLGPFATPHGGFAPMLAVDAGRVVAADPRLTDAQAAQVEPAAICFHAVRATQPRLGDVAVVQGAGPIGLFALQWVLAGGAASVIVVEPSPERRVLATQLGAANAVAPGAEATDAVMAATAGLGADVTYECAGVPATVQAAVDLTRRGGRMCLIGLAIGDASISPRQWLNKEIRVSAALGYSHEEFAMTMGYLADGRLDVGALHTATIGLNDLDTMLAELSASGSPHIKVLVDPTRP